MVLNLTSIEEGDWQSNVFNSIYDAGQGTFKFVAKSPFNWWISGPSRDQSCTYCGGFSSRTPAPDHLRDLSRGCIRRRSLGLS